MLGPPPWARGRLACIPTVRLTNHSQLGCEHQRDPNGEADDIIPDGINDGSNLLVSSAPQDTTAGTLWAGDIHQ